MNGILSLIGSTQGFEISDFDGATAYPDQAFEEEYAHKHTLPPLSFGVLIPERKWPAVSRKMNIMPDQGGNNLIRRLFTQSVLGLDKTGISFHIDTGSHEDQEFELLYNDRALYSNSHELAATISMEKLIHPDLVQVVFEYVLFAHLCASRADSKEVDDLVATINRRLDFYIALIPSWLGLPPNKVEEGQNAYRALLTGLRQRIAPAAQATYDLDQRIGASLVTPIMFSLGSTKEELKKHYCFSPFNAMTLMRSYIDTRKIRPKQIVDILKYKGYAPQPTHL